VWTGEELPHIVHPLGVVRKKHSDKLRMILDARYINEHINIPSFKYEGLESIHELAQRNDYMIVTDYSRGYHHIDLHPTFFTFFGFEWRGVHYTYTSLPFGLASACWAFTKVTRELIYRWRNMGFICSGYLDDGIHFGTYAILLHRMLNFVVPDMVVCGFLLNLVKSPMIPLQVKQYLGMIIDTVRGCMTVPEVRYNALMSLISTALKYPHSCSYKTLEIITGSIISMVWAFGPLSRLMTMSIYYDMQNTRDGYNVSLLPTSIADLNFWLYGFKVHEMNRAI
jgi:hypothetical protein